MTEVPKIKVQRCSAGGTNYIFPDICACQRRLVRSLFTNLSLIHSHTKGSNQNPSKSQKEIRASVTDAFSQLISGCVVFRRKMHIAGTVQS